MHREESPKSDDTTASATRSWLHSALRESLEALRRPLFWAILATAVALTVLAGPFDTLNQLTMPMRFLYWGTGLLLTGVIMTFLSVASRHANAERRVPWFVAAALAGLIGAIPASAIFYTLELLLSPVGPPLAPLRFAQQVAAIMVLISVIGNARIYLRRPPRDEAAAAPYERIDPAPPPASDLPLPLLFEKLPAELGRDLICLRAQDHYVEAVTTRGSAMVLLRLSDAERDLAGFEGLRVHRSWWVNLAHVRDFGRNETGGMDLTMTNGLTVPVARGQRPALKAALDLRAEAAD